MMLKFDADKHEYRYNGRLTSSVTGIISPLYNGSLANIPPAILERKTQIGRAVHLATELHDQDDLNEEGLDDVVRGYFNGYLKFLAENKCKWEGIEQRVYHKAHQYAGTLDRVGVINGKKAIADLKTVAVVSAPTAIQLSAYEQANMEDGDKELRARIAIQLKPNGTYELYDFTMDDVRRKLKLSLPARSDFAVFLSCLTISRFSGEAA